MFILINNNKIYMSESKDVCCDCECSGHGSSHGSHCGHGFGCHRSFFFVRWIFGFLIIATVFSIGLAMGRFVGQVDSFDYGYEGSRMMQYGNDGYYNPGMMRGWVIQTQSGATTATPATKTTK
jgi:hypothetical protein